MKALLKKTWRYCKNWEEKEVRFCQTLVWGVKLSEQTSWKIKWSRNRQKRQVRKSNHPPLINTWLSSKESRHSWRESIIFFKTFQNILPHTNFSGAFWDRIFFIALSKFERVNHKPRWEVNLLACYLITISRKAHRTY